MHPVVRHSGEQAIGLRFNLGKGCVYQQCLHTALAERPGQFPVDAFLFRHLRQLAFLFFPFNFQVGAVLEPCLDASNRLLRPAALTGEFPVFRLGRGNLVTQDGQLREFRRQRFLFLAIILDTVAESGGGFPGACRRFLFLVDKPQCFVEGIFITLAGLQFRQLLPRPLVAVGIVFEFNQVSLDVRQGLLLGDGEVPLRQVLLYLTQAFTESPQLLLVFLDFHNIFGEDAYLSLDI